MTRMALLGIVSAGLSLLVPGICHAEADAAVHPSPDAVAALQLIASDDSYQQRLGFLRLEALREPATIPLITPYLDHKHPTLRAYGVRALAAVAGAAAVPALLRVLQSDRREDVRRAALLGLEPLQANDPAVLSAFIDALTDRKSEVRITAVDIVSRIDDPQARRAIEDRQERERNGNVRRALALALRRLASDE